MTDNVFVDTNVFVYARDAGEGAKQRIAADWLRRLWVDQRGRISVQVLSEYYVTVTRKLTPGLDPEQAWEDVVDLFAWKPQPVTSELLARARDVERRFGLSWWDSMIVASAAMQGCALLLSEDLQDGLICGGVTVRSPFTLDVAEEGEAYRVFPAPVSRHRRRGRPARASATT